MERRIGPRVGPAAVAAGLALALPSAVIAQHVGMPRTSTYAACPPGPSWAGSAYPGGPATSPVGVPGVAGVQTPTGQIPGMSPAPLPYDTGAPPASGQLPGPTPPQPPIDAGPPPLEPGAPGTAPTTPPPPVAPPEAAPLPAPTPFSGLTAPGATPGLDAAVAGPAPGLSGVLGGEGAGTLTMIGDSPPIFPRFAGFAVSPQQFEGEFPPPVVPPIPGEPQFGPELPERLKSRAVYTGVRGIKICENQSPLPQDRIYFSFNYFNDVNGEVNSRLGSPLTNINIYRYILGFEKTFLDGQGSFGLRVPLDNLGANAVVPGLLTQSTAVGDLIAYTKYALYYNRETGDIFTGGLLLGIPTGPDNFAGFRNIQALNSFRLQPFVGYIYNFGRFYFQGFSSISVPTETNDVTLWYNDNGIGYFLYRAEDPNRLISVIAPTFEVHVNTPLNHSDPFDPLDLAATANYVNFTYGVNIGILRRGLLSIGYIHPVTDPQPFEGELAALFNVRF